MHNKNVYYIKTKIFNLNFQKQIKFFESSSSFEINNVYTLFGHLLKFFTLGLFPVDSNVQDNKNITFINKQNFDKHLTSTFNDINSKYL